MWREGLRDRTEIRRLGLDSDRVDIWIRSWLDDCSQYDNPVQRVNLIFSLSRERMGSEWSSHLFAE
jgi:hypothetical protein